MAKIDLEQERQRLAKLYAEMSDEELAKVGQDPAALTEWAQEALRTEMRRRGLEWRDAAGEAEMPTPREDDTLVLARVYADTMRAAQDKSVLEGAGFEVHLFGERTANLGGLTFWIPSDGIRLMVRSSERAAALEVLEGRAPLLRDDNDRSEDL
jgi:hypothetical protein